MNDVIEKFKDLEQKYRKKTDQNVPVTELEPALKQVILFKQPWAEALRAAPLTILRSALFGVMKGGNREYLNNIEIASWPGVSIRYKGERLDQYDLDVWMLAVHLFRHRGLGERITVSAYSLLQALGRSTEGKDHYLRLNDSFMRMVACAVVIKAGRYSYTGNLVYEFWYDEKADQYVLSINPHLASLFAEGYSLIEWQQREQLGKKSLAKWLLGYVATHRATVLKPHRIGLDKLQKLCGTDMEAKDFKRWTRHYMDDLKTLDAVASWHFSGTDNNSLEFIKRPRQSQRKPRGQK